jgi:hypothetical protein
MCRRAIVAERRLEQLGIPCHRELGFEVTSDRLPGLESRDVAVLRAFIAAARQD